MSDKSESSKPNEKDEYWMQHALSLAQEASAFGEVPVGALQDVRCETRCYHGLPDLSAWVRRLPQGYAQQCGAVLHGDQAPSG